MDDGSRKLKVTFLCATDRLGGAAIVTYRLLNALCALGVDARMVVYTKFSSHPRIDGFGTRMGRGLRFIWERAVIFANNGLRRDNLFKVSVANTGMPVWRHPWVREADVINLSWINQGLLSLRGIRRLGRLGKPLVWTMHDMWCMTGICHHAYECRRYEKECGRCPLLHSTHPHDLSHRTWLRKDRLYADQPITFVAVSNWLAERARQSSLLRGARVEVIPNAFPVNEFYLEPLPNFPSYRPLKGQRRIIFAAARLDDPIKGLDIFIEACNSLFDNSPEIANDTTVVFLGALHNAAALDNMRFPYINLGFSNDPKLQRQVFASGDVVVSTSHYETLPSTLIEGQAAGCVPVTFDHGGQADIVEHLRTGYMARYLDPEDVAEGIRWALSRPVAPEALHAEVERKFAADVIARRYIDLYRALARRR